MAAALALQAEVADGLGHAGIGVVLPVVERDDPAGRDRRLPGAKRGDRLVVLVRGVDEDGVDGRRVGRAQAAGAVVQVHPRALLGRQQAEVALALGMRLDVPRVDLAAGPGERQAAGRPARGGADLGDALCAGERVEQDAQLGGPAGHVDAPRVVLGLRAAHRAQPEPGDRPRQLREAARLQRQAPTALRHRAAVVGAKEVDTARGHGVILATAATRIGRVRPARSCPSTSAPHRCGR